MVMKKKFIFINSCDRYQKLWYYIVKRYIHILGVSSSSYTFVINNEVAVCERIKDLTDNIVFVSDIRGPRYFPLNEWSNHLNTALVALEPILADSVILYAQDDYYLLDQDLDWKLGQAYSLMCSRRIDCLHLSNQTIKYDQIFARWRPYYFNTQMALWKPAMLKEVTSNVMNPWIWELCYQFWCMRRVSIVGACDSFLIDYVALIKDGRYLERYIPILDREFSVAVTSSLTPFQGAETSKLNTLMKIIRSVVKF